MMRRFCSTLLILTLLAVLGAACVEDRQLVLPNNGEQTNGKDEGKEDDENKEDDKSEEDEGKGEDGKDDGGEDDGGEDDGGEEMPPIYNDYPDTSWAAGELDWVFDMNALPEIHIEISVDEWNALLEAYDRDNNTND